MGEFFKRLFASDLMPHGVCWSWDPWVVWTNVIPDAITALSYFALSLTLVHLVRHRRERTYGGVVLLFGVFIFACGLTHAMEVWNTWHGAFRLAGAIKIVTAAASLGTALLLLRLAPKIQRAPGLDQALRLDQSLSSEREQRRIAERLLAENQDLATMVQARTQELHESEARLQGFIHHAPAAIAFKDPDGRFLLVNPRMETLLGRPQAEILGHTIPQLFPDPLGTALHRAEQDLAGSGSALEQEEQWTHADGQVHDYLSQKFSLLDGTGRCWGLGVLSTDITDHKGAASALLQSQKLESMGLLAGGIAHDFNNLLGAILGNLGLAQMELSPMAPARQRLETIEALVVRAADLARQMLAYSGRGKFQLKTVNLNDLVQEMTHLLGISISKKAVIRYALEPDLPSIEADPAQLQQVVMNLVINASDAIVERSGTITINTRPVQLDEERIARDFPGQNVAPGPFVCLEVADSGCGMAPEILNRIFDPFFTTKFTGRGLGLAAIQGIVRGHHGGIQVQSEPGRGTTFKLVFPATSLAAEAQRPREAPGSYRGTGTVLVVDDEESIRAMAAGILGHIGFSVLQAEDGLEALKQLRLHEPEITLVVMDLTMPHLDGEETYRAMRQEGFTVPVILSSGFNEMEAVNRFMGKGLAGFLQKPYRADDMVELVRGVLEPDAPGGTT